MKQYSQNTLREALKLKNQLAEMPMKELRDLSRKTCETQSRYRGNVEADIMIAKFGHDILLTNIYYEDDLKVQLEGANNEQSTFTTI